MSNEDNEQIRRSSTPSNWFACSGVWLLFTWIVLANTYRSSEAVSSPRILYIALTISLLTIAAVAVFSSRIRSPRVTASLSSRKRLVDCGAAGLMVVAGFCLASMHHLGLASGTLRNVALATGGIGLGWLYMRWAEFYTFLNVRTMAVFLFAGSILWVVAQVCFELSPDAVRSVGTVTLPCFALLVLWRSFATLDLRKASAKPNPTTGLRGFWKAWTSIVAVSLITAMLIGSLPNDPEASTLWRRVLTVALIAITMWVVLDPHHSVEFSSVWRVVFFVLAISLTMLIVDQELTAVSSFLRSSWQLLIPITWLTVCDIARHTTLNVYVVLGAGFVSYSLPTALGGTLFHQLAAIVNPVTIFALMLFILFAVLALCLSTRDPDTLRIFDELKGQATPMQEFATIDRRCERLGESRSLTQREIEILKMLGKGRSRAYIAETLFISENTVKTHVGHVYSKLGVHSKHELHMLIDGGLELV
ncbi:helix-turn-helix transcriptional regulator [Arabiibacter massiliensis]|uniref:helix-turn-helix transcriptional regulator n=1 Tax=Arabiibacter massiliensis TaxID=1870985 RepID=UPI0009BC4245|nr:helix-turn-helix transcriptional regulator [Arabiibacter massiliensis]